MFSTTRSKVAVGASLVAALAVGGTGIAMAAPALAAPVSHDLIATHHAARHSNVPFTAHNVWTLAKTAYPGLTRDHNYRPVEGTFPAQITRAGGWAAQFGDASGDRIDLAVAHGTAGQFAAQEAQIAAHSTAITSFGPGVKAYQLNGGGTYLGDYEVFVNGYWISMSSNLFTSTAHATPLIQAVLQTIPQG